jgi:putative transposase
MQILTSYKFRLLPNPQQTAILTNWMGACRFIYNVGLEQRQMAYEIAGKSLNYFSQQNELPECKTLQGFEWLKEVPSQSLQMALRHLDRAYKNFFEGRADFPKRKKKGRCTDSISFPQGERAVVVDKSAHKSLILGIPKIKKGLKFIQHRKIEGRIKIITITKKAKQWWISFSCEKEIQIMHNQEITPDNAKENSIGIDLGVAKTICTNKDDYLLDTKKIKKLEKQIAKEQRRLAKQVKFSDKWKKINRIISRKYSKIARIRQDFLHKASTDICKNHAIVCMENLKVKNMSKSASGTMENPGKNVAVKSGLNRAILRQGWGMFRQMCEYKTKRCGGTLVLVNPQNTSRKCSNPDCGHTEKANRQTQEHFCCQKCGHTENADKNASNNINTLGLQSVGLAPQEAPTITALAV